MSDDPSLDILNQVTSPSENGGYFDQKGKWNSGTNGGFFSSEGGEWCEGTVSSGYHTPDGQWITPSLSDTTEIAGTTWGQLRGSAMDLEYQQQSWFDSMKPE